MCDKIPCCPFDRRAVGCAIDDTELRLFLRVRGLCFLCKDCFSNRLCDLSCERRLSVLCETPIVNYVVKKCAFAKKLWYYPLSLGCN